MNDITTNGRCLTAEACSTPVVPTTVSHWYTCVPPGTIDDRKQMNLSLAHLPYQSEYGSNALPCRSSRTVWKLGMRLSHLYHKDSRRRSDYSSCNNHPDCAYYKDSCWWLIDNILGANKIRQTSNNRSCRPPRLRFRRTRFRNCNIVDMRAASCMY